MKLIQIRCENVEGQETGYYNYELVVSKLYPFGYSLNQSYMIDFPNDNTGRCLEYDDRNGFSVLKSECNIIKTLE